jgi:hypothetical protein
MKKLIFLSCFAIHAAHAAITIDHSKECKIKSVRITEFVVSPDNRQLSYRSDGKIYSLAKASSGVLVGRFRALMMGGSLEDFDNKWLDITEIPLSEIESRRPRAIDQVFYYLPLRRALNPSELGLDGKWRITGFVFDYNWHLAGSNGEKEWQFTLKNIRTGATNTIMANDAERSLLEKCHQAAK